MVSTLISVLIILAIVGLVLWGIQQIPGIPPIVKTIIYIVIGVLILLWLLNQVGGSGVSLH
jgi:preprotein translocase subunit SecE